VRIKEPMPEHVARHGSTREPSEWRGPALLPKTQAHLVLPRQIDRVELQPLGGAVAARAGVVHDIPVFFLGGEGGSAFVSRWVVPRVAEIQEGKQAPPNKL
jgi:hypothetical protein